MKIICAGYPKTGTKSMREALDILGYENVHDYCEQVAYDHDIIQKALFDKNATMEDFKRAYCDVDSVTDMPACYMWKQILEAFPNSKVVLMVRDSPDVWLRSYKTMREDEYEYVKYLKGLGGLIGLYNILCPVTSRSVRYVDYSDRHVVRAGYEVKFNENLFDRARSNYINHINDVIKHCPKDQLLIFNLSEGWGPLCKFLGKPIPQVNFPRRNFNQTITAEVYNGIAIFDGGISKVIVRERRRFFAILFCFVIFIFSVALKFFVVA